MTVLYDCGIVFLYCIRVLYCILLRLGLTDAHRGAILCDAWTGSFRQTAGLHIRRQALMMPSQFFFLDMTYLDERYLDLCVAVFPLCRNAWYSQHNVAPPRKQPGGWSSHGQPVDQLHGALRTRMRAKDLASTGQSSNLRNRPAFHELDLRANGQAGVSFQFLQATGHVSHPTRMPVLWRWPAL